MTSKVLRKPSIISISGSTIKIAHPNLSDLTRTYVVSTFTAVGTALSVVDNNFFSDDDWFIMGEVGDGKTEECDVNGTVIRGISITITNSTKFSHEIDTPVTKIYERGIKIYGAATDGGTGTLIASVDAITTPIADAVMIQWNRPYTEYTLISTDTTYAYYYVVFTDGTTSSSASDYVASTGLSNTSAQDLIQSALDVTNTEMGGKISKEFLMRELNNWQDSVTHFTDENGILKDWDFEMVYNETSLALTENEYKYALSGLTYSPKYTNTIQAIQAVKIGNNPLSYIDIDEFDEETENWVQTTLAANSLALATSITLTDSYEFSESGSVYVGSDTVAYTANTETTGVLSGCTGTTHAHIAGDSVWQGVTPGLPEKYTIDAGYIKLNVPVETDYVGYKLKIRYLKKLTRLSDFSDNTEIPFTYTAQTFLASKIEARKGNLDEAKRWMDDFRLQLFSEAKSNKAPMLESGTYYDFEEI